MGDVFFMSDCINTVSSLMPSSSGFRKSDVEAIFEETIGDYFDRMEIRIEEVLEAPFLTRASGEYLDIIHGKRYGLKRLPDESDDDYRMRLSFQARDSFQLKDLYELGCKVYLETPNFTLGETWTTRKVQNWPGKLLVECPSGAVEELIKDNIIWEKIMVFI